MDDQAAVAFDTRALARAWHTVLGQLELELNPHTFATWLKGTRAGAFDGRTLTVTTTSAMACEFLDRRMRLVVERAAASAIGSAVTVSFVPAAGYAPASPEQPPAPPRPAARPAIGTVNCAYTFEDYQAANGNALALRACVALVDDSEFRVSPVVLYGAPGVGKTHLLHALACRGLQAGQLVACLSAEEFANRFLTAMRAERLAEFHAEIRSVTLLVIDDLQAIVGKKATQDELVRTMDAVTHNGGHVVVASERLPFELGLPERLESRLAAGLITRVEPFLFDERREYVHRVARQRRAALPAWAIDRIAAPNLPSVRALLGCINGALALHRDQRLDPRSLDACLAAIVIRDCGAAAPGAELLERVARHFELAVDDLTGPARSARLTEARAVAVAALHRDGRPLSRLADLFHRDKSTVSGLANRGRGLIAGSDELRRLLAG